MTADIAERVAAAIKDNEAMDNARAMLEGEKYVFMRNEKVMDVLFPDRQTSVDEAWLDVEDEDEDNVVHAMNRNARKPKKANHGARPCSRVGRRKRRYARYKKSGTKV
jgi:signal transduction histidine kinase